MPESLKRRGLCISASSSQPIKRPAHISRLVKQDGKVTKPSKVMGNPLGKKFRSDVDHINLYHCQLYCLRCPDQTTEHILPKDVEPMLF